MKISQNSAGKVLVGAAVASFGVGAIMPASVAGNRQQAAETLATRPAGPHREVANTTQPAETLRVKAPATGPATRETGPATTRSSAGADMNVSLLFDDGQATDIFGSSGIRLPGIIEHSGLRLIPDPPRPYHDWLTPYSLTADFSVPLPPPDYPMPGTMVGPLYPATPMPDYYYSYIDPFYNTRDNDGYRHHHHDTVNVPEPGAALAILGTMSLLLSRRSTRRN